MYLPFAIMSIYGSTELRTMTAAWLLPIVSPIVAAATGGIVAEALPNARHAATTVIASYALWGTGVPLALAVLVIYFHRLTVHKLPPREVIVSVFLPLGPLGQGGFAAMQLGKVARAAFPATGTLGGGDGKLPAGDVLYVCGWLLAVVMWGFGLVWLFFALAGIARAARFPFNMGWWGFTFPLGVFATSTIQIGVEMPSAFFKVLGQIFSVAVILLWCLVAARTARGAWSGKLFFAPCLANLKKDGEDGEDGGEVERAA